MARQALLPTPASTWVARSTPDSIAKQQVDTQEALVRQYEEHGF
jgi:hypothetical protein